MVPVVLNGMAGDEGRRWDFSMSSTGERSRCKMFLSWIE